MLWRIGSLGSPSLCCCTTCGSFPRCPRRSDGNLSRVKGEGDAELQVLLGVKGCRSPILPSFLRTGTIRCFLVAAPARPDSIDKISHRCPTQNPTESQFSPTLLIGSEGAPIPADKRMIERAHARAHSAAKNSSSPSERPSEMQPKHRGACRPLAFTQTYLSE